MASFSKRAARAPSCAANRVAGSHWPWLPMNVTGSCAGACLMDGVLGEFGATGADAPWVAGTAAPPAWGAGLLGIAGGECVAADAPVPGETTPMSGWELEPPPWSAAAAPPLAVAWLPGTGAGLP